MSTQKSKKPGGSDGFQRIQLPAGKEIPKEAQGAGIAFDGLIGLIACLAGGNVGVHSFGVLHWGFSFLFMRLVSVCWGGQFRFNSSPIGSVHIRIPSFPVDSNLIRFFSHLLYSFPFPLASKQRISISTHITRGDSVSVPIRSRLVLLDATLFPSRPIRFFSLQVPSLPYRLQSFRLNSFSNLF